MIGCFVIVKVLVNKILFKAYRLIKDLQVYSLGANQNFLDNCVVMGYTLIAAISDILFYEYREMF
jgi:hypothetical protein